MGGPLHRYVFVLQSRGTSAATPAAAPTIKEPSAIEGGNLFFFTLGDQLMLGIHKNTISCLLIQLVVDGDRKRGRQRPPKLAGKNRLARSNN